MKPFSSRVGCLGSMTAVMTSLLMLSCGHTMSLTSTPSTANVYFLDVLGNRTSLAGQTPLSLKAPPDGGTRYILEIEKTGFIPRILVMDQPHILGSDSKVSVLLTEQNQEWFTTAMTGAFSTETSALVNQFVELKTRIAERNSVKVKKLETQMKEKFGVFSAFNALMGEFYFRQKNFPVATKYLQRAVELNPQDLTSRLLLSRLATNKKK